MKNLKRVKKALVFKNRNQIAKVLKNEIKPVALVPTFA
jgi:hypothetical protein